jgi:PAS domain S-box-containing protein
MNKSLHSKILDALPINIFLEDPEGRTIFANQQASKAHGVDMEKLVGKTVFDFFPKTIAARQREIDLEV